MEFLNEHLFGSLPSQYYSQIVGTLIPQLQSSLLEHLKRAIPSHVTGLPQYISVVERAIAFEATIVQANASPAGSIPLGRPINDWAAKLSNHYEKKRRLLILQDVRNILCGENHIGGLRVEKPSKVAKTLEIDDQPDAGVNMPAPLAPADRAATSSAAESVDKEDGWGFDDFGGEEETEVKESIVNSSFAEATTAEEPDPWDDDPWDDPLDNEPTVAKSAKGLEKFSSKSKGSSLDSFPPKNGSMNGSGPQSSLPSTLPSLIVPSHVAMSRPHDLSASKNKETFLVSECAQAVVKTLRAVVQEGQDLARAR